MTKWTFWSWNQRSSQHPLVPHWYHHTAWSPRLASTAHISASIKQQQISTNVKLGDNITETRTAYNTHAANFYTWVKPHNPQISLKKCLGTAASNPPCCPTNSVGVIEVNSMQQMITGLKFYLATSTYEVILNTINYNRHPVPANINRNYQQH